MNRILLLILSIIFTSCANNIVNEGIGEKDLMNIEEIKLHGNYLLKELTLKDVSSEKIVLKFDSIQKSVSGYAGCNSFGADFEHSVEKIKFTKPVTTKMYCEDKMEKEQEIMKVLPEISEVTEVKEQIVFYSGNNQRLLTIQKED
jgi:heat shock protein HslJ